MELFERDKKLTKEWSTSSKTDLVRDILSKLRNTTSALIVRVLKFNQSLSKVFAYNSQVRIEGYILSR